jgi:predicted metal-dependent hydrolase
MNAQADDWQPLETTVPKEIFKAEVAAWAKRIGVAPRQLHVRPMKKKWGSCSTAGRVTFDAELLTQPADFRNQVIVHELLHLKVPNHGKLFKALLRAYLGEYRDGCNPSEKRRAGKDGK